MLCDDIKEWVGTVGESFKREGDIYVYIKLIHVVQQKHTTFEAIILHYKKI